MRRAVFTVVGAMALAAALVSCVTPVHIDTPEGFARYVDTDDPLAVSPEGVLIRARLVDNDPPQSLEFWAEALQQQLEASGYFLVEQSEFDTDVGPGRLFEWAAPVNGEDWVYLTAIVVTDAQIAVIESAGSFDHYQRHRAAIWESLSTLQIDGNESRSK